MANKFDEFSKHMAKRHSRRGLFRIFGVGVLGAVTAGIFGRSKKTEADGSPLTNLFQNFVTNMTLNPNGFLDINGTLLLQKLPEPNRYFDINGNLLLEKLPEGNQLVDINGNQLLELLESLQNNNDM